MGIVGKCDAFCENLSLFVILFITLKNRCILYKKTNTVTRKKNCLLGGSLFSSNALTFQCILSIFCHEVKRLPAFLGNFSNLVFLFITILSLLPALVNADKLR